jgi:DNA polymerase
MIVLNAPRYLTPSRRELYRQESVELLKKMVAAIGLDIRHCYVTNLVKCESEQVTIKPSEMVANCQPILLRELEELSPRVVLVMGEIMPLQTIIHESTGIEWFNLEHPITLINNPEHKRQAWETLKLVKRSLEG